MKVNCSICYDCSGEKTVFKCIQIGLIWLEAQGVSMGVLVLVGDTGEMLWPELRL